MLFVPRSFGARPLYVAIVSVLLLCRSLPASAAGTGQISGTVTEEKTGAAIAGAGVDAVSPSDRYHTVTDSHGGFAFAGVAVDTYSASGSSSERLTIGSGSHGPA